MIKQAVILILVVFFNSCSSVDNAEVMVPGTITTEELNHREKLSLTPIEYVNWVQKPSSKLLYSKIIDEFKYEILCKPVEYIISKEVRGREINTVEYNRLKLELGTMDYYDFRISVSDYSDEFLRYNLEDLSQYQNRIDYCAFQMENDIKMVDGIDSVSCTLFHFERTFSLTPYGNFLIGIPKCSPETVVRTFVFHDRLFNNGTIKIIIDPSALTHLPKLKTI